MKIDIMNDLSDYQSKQGYFAKKNYLGKFFDY